MGDGGKGTTRLPIQVGSLAYGTKGCSKLLNT